MKKLQDLFNQAKQAVRDFTSSRTRVAILFAVVAALVGAILLLPPPSTANLETGAVQTIVSDAGSSVSSDMDASVVIDLPAPDGSATLDATTALDVADAADERPLPEETCSQ
jgi:hypothetical protein